MSHTPFYSAAKRGDTIAVRQLLSTVQIRGDQPPDFR
jgi:hypothetical protein